MRSKHNLDLIFKHLQLSLYSHTAFWLCISCSVVCRAKNRLPCNVFNCDHIKFAGYFAIICCTFILSVSDIKQLIDGILWMPRDLGPVSQRVAINRTIDINCSSRANHVLRKLAINRNALWNKHVSAQNVLAHIDLGKCEWVARKCVPTAKSKISS